MHLLHCHHDLPTEHGEGFVIAAVIDPFGNVLGIMYNHPYPEMLASAKTGQQQPAASEQ